MNNIYRRDLDALKGIAIIAVVFFHMGLLKSGYLGVDAFFVINGFLVIPSVIKKIQQSDFSFWNFMEKRIIRLLPLIVIASAIALCLGYFLMLPDHYENLAQSVIAGNLMSENILSAITTKNYWDVVNEYKPLMHLWYVGILFEFYIVLPILMLLANKTATLAKQDGNKWMVVTLAVLTTCSFALYLSPIGSTGDKFYYLPYRFFELGIGGLISLNINKLIFWGQNAGFQKVTALLLLLVIFCSIYNVITGNYVSEGVVIGKELSTSNGLPFSSAFALLMTVALSTLVVSCRDGGSLILKSRTLAWFGKMSYSIFIWHQVLLAFYRYSISYHMSVTAVLVFLIGTLAVSSISFYLIEKKIKTSHFSFAGWAVAAILVIMPSAYLYLHAGVVRDIPELDVVKGTEHRGMFGEYCDRIYQFDGHFQDKDNKIKVLVFGNSFGRDFANVLLESSYKDSIDLVYKYYWSDVDQSDLVKKCDYLFVFSSKTNIPDYIWKSIKNYKHVYGIGTKNFGYCNGQVYRNRSTSNYLNTFIGVRPGYLELNKEWSNQWGDNYVDFMNVFLKDRRMPVFTPDGRFISQDCLHLTRSGAIYYATKIDFNNIFKDR